MSKKTERDYRRECDCADCGKIREVLSLLDDIANRPTTMGMDDVEDLCEAREILAFQVGYVVNNEKNRYEP